MNNDSEMLIPLVQEALTIFIDHRVKALFLQHE
jgi:cell division protein FtsL